MKNNISKLFALSIATLWLAGGPALADADDDKWIAKCVKDNKNEGATETVVKKYCECMNDKMDKSETKTVTEWEKTHKKETAECSKEAGWK